MERDPQEGGVNPGLRGDRAAPCPALSQPGTQAEEASSTLDVARAQRLPPGGFLEHLMGGCPPKTSGEAS